MVAVEFDFSLEGRHVLTVHLVSEGPEDTLPNQSRLGVLESQQILIVWALRNDTEVEVGDVEPETDHTNTCNQRPALEPSLRVDIVKSPIGVSLKRSSNWETMRSVRMACLAYQNLA